MPEHRCGFAAIVGRPNVGKSTLRNALLGHKVSIVTRKPQTTRHRILGIHTTADAQILFVDTPGLHRGGRTAMNRYLNRAAAHALVEADVALFVIQALRWTPEDQDVLERLQQARVEIIGVVNKIDRVRPKAKLLPFLAEVAGRGSFAELVPVSALRETNLECLPQLIIVRLPPGPPVYAGGQLTDRSERFRATEIIREKLTAALQQELPYRLTVEIERYETQPGGLVIGAVVWVERAGQKAIVIGKGGEQLKAVGRAARLELRSLLGRPVHLELWVKVKKNWADSVRALRTFGYE